MLHGSCTPCCLPGTKTLVPRTTLAASPSLASHQQSLASPTPKLRSTEAVVTSTHLASRSKPSHRPAALHATDLNADSSSTGLLVQQQEQQQQISRPQKKRGRRPKHASSRDERVHALPGLETSQGRCRPGRRTSEAGAAGSDGRRRRKSRSKPSANSVAEGSHGTLSNGGQTQPSAQEQTGQAHNIPVIPLPPPPAHTGANAGPGPEEAAHVYDFTWRGDEELDDLDEDSSDEEEGLQGSGHIGGSAAHKLAAAADAARLSFGLPTKGWSARKQRRALERGQLPWGMSPCLQDEQLLNKAMQLVYSGGPKEESLDDPALANVGWGNRISVRTSEGSGAFGKGTSTSSSSSSNVGHAPSNQHGSSRSSSGVNHGEGLTGGGSMLPCPPRFIGPVEIKPIAGKGWGLVATDIIEPGEAVLVSEPLIAACSTQPGQPPSPLVLLPWLRRLQRELPTDHPARVALHALWHGRMQEDADASSSSSSSSSGSRSSSGSNRGLRGGSKRDGVMCEEGNSSRSGTEGPTGRALVRVPDIVSWELTLEDGEEGWQKEEEEEQEQDQLAASSRKHSSRGGALRSGAGAGGRMHSSGRGAQQREELEEAELQGLLLHNVFGDSSEDPATALCRGDGSHPLIGVWPEFSLINHACLPNAVHVLLGGRMVVRATAPIMPNQEITVNYLGHAALAPYIARQEELQGMYGFSCTCARCRVELSHLRELGGTFEEVCMESALLQGELQEVIPSMQRMSQHCQPQPNERQGSRHASQAQHLQQQQQKQEQSPQGLQQQGQQKQEQEQQQQHAVGQHQHSAAVGGSGVDDGGQQAPSWAAIHERLQELHTAAVVLRQHLLQKVGRVATLEASHPHKRLYVLAAAFDVYNTLFDIRQALAAHATAIPLPEASTPGLSRPISPGPHFSLGCVEVLQQMVELVEVCLPGSDLQTLLSARLAQQSALRYGVSDSRTLSAERTCVNGHMLRYGPCTTPVIDGLVDAGLEVLARASPFHPSALQGAGTASDAGESGAASDDDAKEGDDDDGDDDAADGINGRTRAVPRDLAAQSQDGTQPPPGVVVLLPSWLRDMRGSEASRRRSSRQVLTGISTRAATGQRGGAAAQRRATAQGAGHDASLDTMLEGLLLRPVIGAAPSAPPPNNLHTSKSAKGDGEQHHLHLQQQAEEEEEDEEEDKDDGSLSKQDDWKKLWRA